MAGEWRDCLIGDIADVIGGSTPSTKDPSNFDGDVPWLTPKDLSGPHDRYVTRGERNLTRQGLASCSAQLVPAGTVLLSSRAPIGYVAIAKNPIATNQGFRNLLLRPGSVPGFLYYWLTANVPELERHSSGSTFKELSGGALKQIQIRIPSEPEQRAIAHILGTLDDKIELNRRKNETLEAMARALFKSWFVDFDPVRAKAEGRDPGLPKPLADLFPDSFEDSELGEIPKGWAVKVLDDLAGVVLGGDWGVDEPSLDHTERARCVRGADIPDLQAGGTGKMPVRYLKPSSLEKRRLSEGDLVIEISGGSPTQSTGRPVLVSERLLQRLDAPLVCSNFCRMLKPKKRAYSKYVYLWLRALYSADEFLQFENGTTGIKNLAFTLFSSRYKLCMPSDDVLEAFEQRVAPAFARQQSTAAEADSLGALRDTLLPKLISGEVRIKLDREIVTEATA